jgi:hypothetical protein
MSEYKEGRGPRTEAAKAKWKAQGIEWWTHKDPKVRAYYQLQEEILIIPWDDFHRSTEALMGRPVYTHEFAYPDELLEELKSGKKATLDDILEKAAGFGKPVITVDPNKKEVRDHA